MHGIITAEQRDPLVEWRARITFIGSDAVADAVKRLLVGEQVISRDGEVEISWRENLTSPRTITVTVRVPAAPFVADLVVRPLIGPELLKGEELRSAEPCPERWCSVGKDTQTWQLFNCVVYSLTTRGN